MDDAKRLQYLFQTLGDANRLRILKHIGEEASPVSEIVNATGLSQPLVSHHLRTLRKAGVLTTKRKGPFVFYSLRNRKLLELLGMFSEIAQGLGDDNFSQEPLFFCPPWWKKRIQ